MCGCPPNHAWKDDQVTMTTIITRDQMRPGQMQQDDLFGGAA